MDTRRYKRYFVILDEEDQGFSNKPGETPKGYIKMETKNGKGVLRYYLENMKYFKDASYVYRGYLVGTKNGKRIYQDTGAFMIDEKGKAESKWTFHVDDVDGKGSTISDFNVITVVAKPMEKQRNKEVLAPLVGFIDKDRVPFKDVLRKICTTSKKVMEAENIHQVKSTFEQASLKEEQKVLKLSDKQPKEHTQISTKEVKKEEKVPQKESIKEEQKVEDQTIEVNTLKEEPQEETEKEIEEEQKEELKEEIEEELEEEPKQQSQTEVQEQPKVQEVEDKGLKEETQKPVDEPKEDVAKEEVIKEPDVMEMDIKEHEYPPHPYGNMRYGQEYEVDYGSMKYYECKNPYTSTHQYFKMVCEYTQNMLKYHKECEPFEKPMPGCKWWRMDYNCQTMYRNCIPFYGYIQAASPYTPYANGMSGYPQLLNKYQHYIFGIEYDESQNPKHYLYGVPGRYLAAEQPYGGMTGFVYWHSLEDKPAEKGDYGYWILHIDAQSGSVDTPQGSTVAPR